MKAAANKNVRFVNIVNILLYAATIATVLTYFTVRSVSDFTEVLYPLLWIAVLGLMIWRGNPVKFDKRTIRLIISYILCIIFHGFAILAQYHAAQSSPGIAMYLPYCVCFYFIGYNLRGDDSATAMTLMRVYVVAVLCVALQTYFGVNWVNQKNQLGQILGVAAVTLLLVFPKFTKKKIIRIACYAGGIFLLFSLNYIEARTPMAAAIAAVGWHILSKYRGKRKKHTVSVGLIAAVIALIALAVLAYEMRWLDRLFHSFSPEHGRDIVFSEAVGDWNKMDILLSGRLSVITTAVEYFFRSPMLGVGAYFYRDNFALHVLASGGICYGLALFPASYGVMWATNREMNAHLAAISENSPYYLCRLLLRYLTVFYVVESLGEGCPPLGPGTSSFIYWIVLGLSNTVLRSQKQKESLGQGSEKDIAEEAAS